MLKIRELKKYFPVKTGFGKGKEHLKAVDGVSWRFRLAKRLDSWVNPAAGNQRWVTVCSAD
jgi:hypothetical protein